MFKIGEFSKITQVSVRMLRYYDEQRLLIPDTVDRLNGYRLYTAVQIERLHRIVLLRDMGFGVKEIRELLDAWNPELLRETLLKQMEKTKETILAEQGKLMQIQGRLKDLGNPDQKPDIQIIMKQLPARQVMSLRRTMPDYYCEGILWKELGEAVREIGDIELSLSFSVYHDLDHREKDVDIEACIVTERRYEGLHPDIRFRQTESVDMAACFMIHGPYSNIGLAYREFAFWLEQHDEYCMAGENRQICHVSVCDTDNPEDYITELQVPLRYCNAPFA